VEKQIQYFDFLIYYCYNDKSKKINVIKSQNHIASADMPTTVYTLLMKFMAGVTANHKIFYRMFLMVMVRVTGSAQYNKR